MRLITTEHEEALSIINFAILDLANRSSLCAWLNKVRLYLVLTGQEVQL
jgi:hypothetical protein